MAIANRRDTPSLIADRNEPVYVIPITADGQDRNLYLGPSEYAQRSPGAAQRALELGGSWSDLDEDEIFDVLERIRSDSRPTPPIDEQLAWMDDE